MSLRVELMIVFVCVYFIMSVSSSFPVDVSQGPGGLLMLPYRLFASVLVCERACYMFSGDLVIALIQSCFNLHRGCAVLLREDNQYLVMSYYLQVSLISLPVLCNHNKPVTHHSFTSNSLYLQYEW